MKEKEEKQERKNKMRKQNMNTIFFKSHLNIQGVIEKHMVTLNAAAKCHPMERQEFSIQEVVHQTSVTVGNKFQLVGAVGQL